jgi:hypothetical protein
MKKILLLLSFGCMILTTATFAQNSASVLSPSAPTVKLSMADEDQQSNQSNQTKPTNTTANLVSPTTATNDSKKDDDSDHMTCSRDGCTHHHRKEEPSCKKDEKPEPKPTFMQDQNAH